MKPITRLTIQPIKNVQTKKCSVNNFQLQLEDLNEKYIKQNLRIKE